MSLGLRPKKTRDLLTMSVENVSTAVDVSPILRWSHRIRRFLNEIHKIGIVDVFKTVDQTGRR